MIVLDGGRCVGCQACVVACRQELGRSDGVGALRIGRVYREARYCYQISVCRHCPDPECARVCPEGAFTVREGMVLLQEALCTGCGLCTGACPHGAVEVGERAGKCNLCPDRSGGPACIKTCPTGAINTDRGGE